MGSFAYGVSSDTSDCDVYGFYTPPMVQVFPHTAGYINGFGDSPQMDNGYQLHHIKLEPKEYDVALFSIVKYFNLCMENNPNMIDSLHVPSNCVVHQDAIGEIVREHRNLFLHKGIFHRMRGYAHSQFEKIQQEPSENMKKLREFEEALSIHDKSIDIITLRDEVFSRNLCEDISTPLKNLTDMELAEYDKLYSKLSPREQDRHLTGIDHKKMYHIVRLINEAEQVLTTHTLDLMKDRELLKSIRRGEWSMDQLQKWVHKRESDLETLYTTSDLRYAPDEPKIKELLFQCLEMKFGSLSAYFNLDGSNRVVYDKMKRIKAIIEE